MGWLWASSSSPSTPKPPATDEKPSDPSSSSSSSTAPNQIVDPEIQKFFDLVKDDFDPSKKRPSPSSDTDAESSWFSFKASSRETPQPTTPPALPPNALSEAMLPTEMSCRQAFDLAWSCNSLGGQWNAVYRYGGMRSCSDQWDDFWFCMRTKSYTGEMKERMIREHYRAKEARKYGGGQPNSEDVWESREALVPRGSVFCQDIDEALGAKEE